MKNEGIEKKYGKTAITISIYLILASLKMALIHYDMVTMDRQANYATVQSGKLQATELIYEKKINLMKL